MRGTTTEFSKFRGARCRTTRWSLIASAKDPDSSASRRALGELCQIYWYPLYAFARRRGFDGSRAADLIQSFLCELAAGRIVNTADREKGRFRSYLLGAMKKFIAAEREKSSAQKRGGGVVPLSLDHAELRYGREPAHQYTPERLYERRWALTVIDLARAEVELAYLKAGKGQLFQRLKDLLAGPLPDRTYADIAKELGMTESAVKVAAHRMRRQFRAALSDHIAETVSSPSDVEDELKHLYIAVGNPP